MVDIEYLEGEKTKIVADHIKRCHNTTLDEAEQFLIKQLNWEIQQLKEMNRGKE